MTCKHKFETIFESNEYKGVKGFFKDQRCLLCGKERHSVTDEYTEQTWFENGLWWSINKPYYFYYESELVIDDVTGN